MGVSAGYVYDAVRTPRGKGKEDGALATIAPSELVSQLIAGLADRGHSLDAIGRLVLGCVGQVGSQGGNIALVSRLASALGDEVVATTVNSFCVSGLTAIGIAARAAEAENTLALGGGVECMSQVPFLADGGSYYADRAVAKALRYVPVALAADRLATLEGFSREELDEVTLRSHQRAAAAWSEGRFAAAVVPVRGGSSDSDDRGEVVLDRDELVRDSLTLEKLAALTPAFAAQGKHFDPVLLEATPQLDSIKHLHTIAHCPGMSDGAALVVVGGLSAAGAAKPRAEIRTLVEASGDPVHQLTAGFVAMERALAELSLTLADIDVIEFMEAFAAVPLRFLRHYDIDPARVNIDGGHLAMGHPMGASGAILVSQALDALERRDGELALVVGHGGSGVGAAMVLQRCR